MSGRTLKQFSKRKLQSEERELPQF